MTPEIVGTSIPMHEIRINAKINAMIKLNTGPAATTLIRAQTDLFPNAPASSLSPSSPSIIHAPPNGRSLIEYFVSPFCTPNKVGPKPRQNSLTLTPFFFASKKCPSSWNKMITLKIIIAITNFKLPPALYIFIYCLFCIKNLL